MKSSKLVRIKKKNKKSVRSNSNDIFETNHSGDNSQVIRQRDATSQEHVSRNIDNPIEFTTRITH